MITTSFSAKLRILWSVLLSLVLSSSAFAEVFFLNTDNKESSELNFIDEESKAESEKSEENNSRKHNNNKNKKKRKKKKNNKKKKKEEAE